MKMSHNATVQRWLEASLELEESLRVLFLLRDAPRDAWGVIIVTTLLLLVFLLVVNSSSSSSSSMTIIK